MSYLSEDNGFMQAAIKQAEIAYQQGEIPVGAIVVSQNKIISRAHNQTEKLKDPTAHAEMIAITSACNFLGAKYLSKCTLYVTLEPCIMCYGAIKWSHLARIVYGASDGKGGFSNFLLKDKNLKVPEVAGGVMRGECESLLLSFFNELRLK